MHVSRTGSCCDPHGCRWDWPRKDLHGLAWAGKEDSEEWSVLRQFRVKIRKAQTVKRSVDGCRDR